MKAFPKGLIQSCFSNPPQLSRLEQKGHSATEGQSITPIKKENTQTVPKVQFVDWFGRYGKNSKAAAPRGDESQHRARTLPGAPSEALSRKPVFQGNSRHKAHPFSFSSFKTFSQCCRASSHCALLQWELCSLLPFPLLWEAHTGNTQGFGLMIEVNAQLRRHSPN